MNTRRYPRTEDGIGSLAGDTFDLIPINTFLVDNMNISSSTTFAIDLATDSGLALPSNAVRAILGCHLEVLHAVTTTPAKQGDMWVGSYPAGGDFDIPGDPFDKDDNFTIRNTVPPVDAVDTGDATVFSAITRTEGSNNIGVEVILPANSQAQLWIILYGYTLDEDQTTFEGKTFVLKRERIQQSSVVIGPDVTDDESITLPGSQPTNRTHIWLHHLMHTQFTGTSTATVRPQFGVAPFVTGTWFGRSRQKNAPENSSETASGPSVIASSAPELGKRLNIDLDVEVHDRETHLSGYFVDDDEAAPVGLTIRPANGHFLKTASFGSGNTSETVDLDLKTLLSNTNIPSGATQAMIRVMAFIAHDTTTQDDTCDIHVDAYPASGDYSSFETINNKTATSLIKQTTDYIVQVSTTVPVELNLTDGTNHVGIKFVKTSAATNISTDQLRGRTSRRMGFSEDIFPPTDVHVKKFRRFSKETFPDPISINGQAYHHRIFHTGAEPPTDVHIKKFRRIVSETFPDPISIQGKAFHHKVMLAPPPVEGGSVATNILFETIPPHPVLKGTARQHKVLNTGLEPPTNKNVNRFHRTSSEAHIDPNILKGKAGQHKNLHTGEEPPTDVHIKKFRRFIKEIFPDPLSIKGRAGQHKNLHTGEEPAPVEGGSVVTNIMFETIPPHPVLKGKAFQHKILHTGETPPVPVEGGSVVTNIMFETIPPHPVLNGMARQNRIFHTGEEAFHLISLLSRKSISQQPDPISIMGRAFHHKILHPDPPTDVNVKKFRRLSRQVTPDPISIQGKAFQHKVVNIPPFLPLIDLVFHETINKQPEPNLGLLFRTRTTVRRGAKADAPNFVEFTHFYEQSYRVADAALGLFQLFIGEDAEPDFLSPPAATSSTLPFSFVITPPGIGTKTINAVVRQQNEFGLASFNVFKTTFEIDIAGNEVLGPISPPIITLLEQGDLGRAIAVAEYVGDDINPADKWEFYAKEGSDPVPGVDTPILTGNLLYIGPIASFRADLGDFTPGATLHVIATALRDVDSERGNSAAALIILNLSPDLEEGTTFGGDIKELR